MEGFNNMAGNVTSFARNVNCLLPSWKICTGHDLKGWGNFVKPLTPQKSAFFQRKGRKRVKEVHEVTFMKEWVKPLYISYL